MMAKQDMLQVSSWFSSITTKMIKRITRREASEEEVLEVEDNTENSPEEEEECIDKGEDPAEVKYCGGGGV